MSDPDLAPAVDVPADGLSDSAALSAAPPPYLRLLWPLYLFFRPRTYFQYYVVNQTPLLTALFAWTYGMSCVLDRLSTREMSGQKPLFEDDWNARWLFVAVGGAVAGALFYALGGWWYRVRLMWSGAVDPDKHLVRRVFIFASQIVALPYLVIEAVHRGSFPTPAAADSSQSLTYFVLLVFPFWSTWTSYAGATTAFEVRRGAALFWFLIAPVAVYLTIFAVAFGAGFLLLFATPDVKKPKYYVAETMTFSYPSNWKIAIDDENYDEKMRVPVMAPDGSGTFLTLVPSFVTPQVQLDTVEHELQHTLKALKRVAEFEHWGRLRGLGRVYEAVAEGQRLDIYAFAGPTDAGSTLYAQEICRTGARERLRRGFELIRDSLVIRKFE